MSVNVSVVHKKCVSNDCLHGIQVLRDNMHVA